MFINWFLFLVQFQRSRFTGLWKWKWQLFWYLWRCLEHHTLNFWTDLLICRYYQSIVVISNSPLWYCTKVTWLCCSALSPITVFHVRSRFSNATALGSGFVYDKQGFWFSRSYQRTRSTFKSTKLLLITFIKRRESAIFILSRQASLSCG